MTSEFSLEEAPEGVEMTESNRTNQFRQLICHP
jgi:hypothetical protein